MFIDVEWRPVIVIVTEIKSMHIPISSTSPISGLSVWEFRAQRVLLLGTFAGPLEAHTRVFLSISMDGAFSKIRSAYAPTSQHTLLCKSPPETPQNGESIQQPNISEQRRRL